MAAAAATRLSTRFALRHPALSPHAQLHCVGVPRAGRGSTRAAGRRLPHRARRRRARPL